VKEEVQRWRTATPEKPEVLMVGTCRKRISQLKTAFKFCIEVRWLVDQVGPLLGQVTQTAPPFRAEPPLRATAKWPPSARGRDLSLSLPARQQGIRVAPLGSATCRPRCWAYPTRTFIVARFALKRLRWLASRRGARLAQRLRGVAWSAQQRAASGAASG